MDVGPSALPGEFFFGMFTMILITWGRRVLWGLSGATGDHVLSCSEINDILLVRVYPPSR